MIYKSVVATAPGASDVLKIAENDLLASGSIVGNIVLQAPELM